MRKAFVFLLLLSAFYLATGLVYDEGGFGFHLILKQKPSLTVSFGGGEEGAWIRHHPHEPLPYWKTGQPVVLLEGDWEEGEPLWTQAYYLGYLLAWLGWPIYGCVALIRFLIGRRNLHPRSAT